MRRPWGTGGLLVFGAALAGLVAGSILSLTVPRPIAAAPPGPVLETVTPAQLAAMNLRLEPTVQPVQLPDWLTSLGARPPSTILMRPDAEAAVHKSSGAVRSVLEVALTYATLTTSGGLRVRGHSLAHRLAWAVVGTRAIGGSFGGVRQTLWLVDARDDRQVTELTVPAPLPGGAPAAGPPGR